ncbi:FliG C-terminal domain-containing protein [Thiomicrospira microaerophila]|uniref:FliG C-terminal domain-containing protein n=1 Tax=Thiomicrospira microaerophila TaxID=406020 RepID=UPI0005C946F3|nr:FliG C-terminal domain-containing protein [Thiomicrospira microaerophila]
MKIGMQKVNDNEWLIQMGNAIVRLDRFTTHLLRISLKHSLRSAGAGQDQDAVIKSYLKMALKLKFISSIDWPQFMQRVDKSDLRVWLTLLQDPDLKRNVLRNMGQALEKQMLEDIQTLPLPDKLGQKEALVRMIRLIYELEDQGVIEFHYDSSAYL